MHREGGEVLVGDLPERSGVVDGELLPPGLGSRETLGKLLDALAAGVFGHGAGLEGAEVALERRVGLAELGLDAFQLCLTLGALVVELGEGARDRVADDRLLLEQGGQLVENRLV